MHQYKLIATLYTIDGAPTNQKIEVYADSAEQLATQYKRYNDMHYEKTEEHPGGYKMYSVRIQVAAYCDIASVANFFKMFNIEI